MNSKILINIYFAGALFSCAICIGCLTKQANGISSGNPPNKSTNDSAIMLRLPVKMAKYPLPGDTSSASINTDEDYTLGPGDLLNINVFGSEEFNAKVRVPQSGYVSIPYIGSVLASGLNISELEFSINALLAKDYLHEPQVTVFVDEYDSKKVFVVGSVKKPQVVKLKENKSTLLEIISMVGGLNDEAGEVIYIIRPSKGFGPAKFSFNNEDKEEQRDSSEYLNAGDVDASREDNINDDKILRTMDEITIVRKDDLINYRNPDTNIEIYHNDIISIPSADFCFVMGEVENPGAYQMKSGMTVLQAISMAGRFLETSNLRKLRIIRKNPATDEEYIIKINLKRLFSGKDKNLLVRSGDIYIVGESTLKKLAMQTKVMAQIAFSAFTNAYAWDAIRSDN